MLTSLQAKLAIIRGIELVSFACCLGSGRDFLFRCFGWAERRSQLMMCSRKRRKGKRKGKGKGRGKGDPGSFLRCRQSDIIIRIFMRRSARVGKEGRVQSNQLHACNLIRETGKA